MITGLLAESGIAVSDISIRGDHDELVLVLSPGWRSREGRARIFYRTVAKRDATDLDKLARQTALSEVLLFEVGDDASAPFTVPASVQFVSAAELIERLEDSAVIRWSRSSPRVDRALLAGLRAVDRSEPWVDNLGLRPLPVLARNKTPPDWLLVKEPPDELFERLTFRLMTHVFRFSGTDLGATRRAEREPDALLESPALAPNPFSVVLDCKASRDGWSMSADDETRLINYVVKHRAELAHPDDVFLVVVSSAFPDGTRAFQTRQLAVADGCGAKLVYVRASHLVAAALAVEISRMAPRAREALPWVPYFSQGRTVGGIHAFRAGEDA